MEKNNYIITLINSYSKQEFLKDNNYQCVDNLENIPNTLILLLDENELTNLKINPNVVVIEDQNVPTFTAEIENLYAMSKIFTVGTPSTDQIGSNYAPMQFYYFTDSIDSNNNQIGFLDDFSAIAGQTYSNYWTGKNVDIVSLEVIEPNYLTNLTGIHDIHPEFVDNDNPSISKVIPMDWSIYSSSVNAYENNQTTSNKILTNHAASVVSITGGNVCGFAKKSSFRIIYDSNSVVAAINAVINWHNSKNINSETGVKNPTILIAEFQYLLSNNIAVKIDDIETLNIQGTIYNKPETGWADYTIFVNNNLIPKRVLDPISNQWNWCITVARQNPSVSLFNAYSAAWNSGIVCINAAGNDCGVYVKSNDPRWNEVYFTTSSTTVAYTITFSGTGSTTSIVQTSAYQSATLYPFRAFGPHGTPKSIDVAASQNSDRYPFFDNYATRGPGLDVSGMGKNTWSVTISDGTPYADGYRYRFFSGSSAAVASVTGLAACLMEWYFNKNKVWPTPDDVKRLLKVNARNILTGTSVINWASPPAPDTIIFSNELFGESNLYAISTSTSLNGNLGITELASSPESRAFFPDLLRLDNGSPFKKLRVISDGDPYPALAGTPLTNDGITSRAVFSTGFTISDQSYNFSFRYRGGDSLETQEEEQIKFGAIGIAANGVVFYSPSLGKSLVPYSNSAPPPNFEWNAVHLENLFGVDAAGGAPEVNGEYHYRHGKFLYTTWNNTKFLSNNNYYSSVNFENDYFRHIDGHSKILGYAFDGCPIYGPYSYIQPSSKNSGVKQMLSSYRIKASEDSNRTYTYTQVSAGSFLQDYEYIENLGDLDEHNGRFTVTPDYPKGTYAYFLTFENNNFNTPAFPYVCGLSTRYQRMIEDQNALVGPPYTYTFYITNFDNLNWEVSGLADNYCFLKNSNPTITIILGDTLNFSINSPGVTCYIKTSNVLGTGSLASGVTNNGISVGTITWTPSAVGTYYYVSSDNAALSGIIQVKYSWQ